MFHILTINTMSKTLISESEYLFALCITDGVLEEMGDEQRSLVLLTITNMKRRLLQERDDTTNETI